RRRTVHGEQRSGEQNVKSREQCTVVLLCSSERLEDDRSTTRKRSERVDGTRRWLRVKERDGSAGDEDDGGAGEGSRRGGLRLHEEG
ncbi:hypothetical protein A2U01_0084384, partial [Trifolium medium]|nr:hypothetical protein [Trifolium medium]